MNTYMITSIYKLKLFLTTGSFIFLLMVINAQVLNAQISLTSGTYTQDFNTLANSGTSSTLPSGWLFEESGTNANTTYSAGTGSGTAGDTYSFGSTSSTDRAFGGLLSGSLIPTIGAFFQNNTGATINSLTISYTGEQWRLGALGREDRLEFEYSTNATSLLSGTFTSVTALNFISPVTGPTVGALDGNASANRTTLTHTITGLSISSGAVFYIRWLDFNAAGADDGTAIDDFSLSFTTMAAGPSISGFSPTSACAGSSASVVVSGNNFVTVTDVSFNGVSASFVINSATQITATLPAGATTGQITVSGTAGSSTSAGSFTVNLLPSGVSVSGGGTFCGSTTLTASGGTGGTIYFQGTTSGGISTSTPSTSQVVSSSGTYYFRSLSSAGCWGPEGSATVVINTASTPVLIFTESMGTVTSTTAIAAHEAANGFDNIPYTMSGTGDVRSTTASSGYTGASGAANIFLTNNGTASFQIAGVNTLGHQQLTLGFGIFKSTTASNGSELVVDVSADGVSYTPISFTVLPTGTGTATWHYRTATGSIPAVSNLRIRFTNTSTSTQFRIDDVSLTGQNTSSTITANGPTTFCPGGSVILAAPNAASYLWSNGATTQNITVSATGSFSCQLTYPNGCVVVSNTITVNLNSEPLFTSCQPNIIDNAPSNACSKAVNYVANASGTPTPALSYSFGGATTGSGSGSGSGSLFNVGITQVTVTATNTCGTATCIFTITIADNTPPNAVCQSATVMLDASGNGTLLASQVNNGSNDACGISSISVSPNTFNCSNLLGGAAPTDLFISEYIEGSSNNKCIEIFNGTGSAVNLAAGGYQLLFYFNGSTSLGLTINLTGTVAPGDVYVVCNSGAAAIFLAQADQTNGSGWYNGDDAVVLVKNLGSTVLDIFGRIGEDPGAAWVSGSNSTLDQTLRRVGTITSGVTVNPASGFPTLGTEWTSHPTNDDSNLGSHSLATGAGVVPVTLTVTDNNGNTSSCTTTVTVVDAVPPTVICQSVTVYLDANGSASVTAAQIDNGSSDACGIASMTVTPSSFGCSNLGANTVTLTVTDVNGNSATCTSTVTVVDNTAPVVNCQPVTVILDANGNGTITPAMVNNGSTDNCGIVSMALSQTNFSCLDVGVGSVSSDLIISEYIEGTSNNKCIEIFNGTSSAVNLTAEGYQLRIYFNGSTSSTNINLSGVIPAGGTHVVCNTQSAAGFLAIANQTTGSLSFNGNDAVVLYKGSTSQNLDIFGRVGEDPGSSWSAGGLQTIDRTLRRKNNIINGVTVNPGAGFPTLATEWDGYPVNDLANLGSHSVLYGTNVVALTVTDASGNSSTCHAAVTVVDNTPPVAACQIVTVVLDANGNGSTTATAVNNGSSDACGIASMSLSQTSFNCSNLGSNNVILTVTDNNGNSSTCNAVVTVVDNIQPVINCPTPISVSNDAGQCGSIINYSVSASDNCTHQVQQIAGLPSGTLFPVGTTVNTFMVTDAAGNTSSCSFSVTVVDNENPVITNVPSSFSACNPISWIPPTITDNCPGVQVVSSHVPGSNFPAGTTTVTYTATDVYGHVSIASFNVTRLEESTAATGITSNREYNNICLGENITLTVVGGSLGEAASWKWYTGSCGGVLAGTGSTLTVTPVANTTYYVRAEGTCNFTACAQITVVVSSGPPTQAVVYNTVPSFGAPGVTSTISVNPVAGATYYRWFTNNGQINAVLFNGQISPVQTSIPTVDITFVLPQSNYQIRVMAGNACGRTQQSNAHVRGTVEAPTSLTGPTLACPGQTLSYTVSAVSGTNTTYNWQLIPSGAGTISGTGLTRQITFAAGFTTAQLCVNGISNFGLPGAPICIVISTNAPTPGTVSGLSTPCQGSTHTYSIAAVTGATSYNWTSNIPGVSIVNNGTSATVTFPNNVFSGNICVSANSACGVSAPSCKAITSGAPGVPGPISGPLQGICGASNVNYSLSTSNANSYQWNVPAGVTISGAGNMNSVNLNFGAGFTSGTIEVIAYYDCGSASSTLIVTGAPNAPVVTPATICAGTTELYFASSTGATSYNWTVIGADYNACTNPPTCSQQYIEWGVSGGSFSVTATNSCGTSVPFNLSTNCKIAEVSELIRNIYPNPSNGLFNIEFGTEISGTLELRVTDLSGREIHFENIDLKSLTSSYPISLANVKPGVYLLLVRTTKGSLSVSKIAIE
jgi:predicted extracellular nuclease